MTGRAGRQTWGILGGLGPLASAAFLQTVYEQYSGVPEQELPTCLMISDPTFPDRTTRLLRGEYEELSRRLEEALSKLVGMGADRLFIACVTIHAVLPRVPGALRDRVTSLLDVVAREGLARDEPQLLACTLGTYDLELFQNLSPAVASRLVIPSPRDRESRHRLLYRIRAGADLDPCLKGLESLLERYRVGSFVAGCTELHLLTRRLPRDSGISFIDPLDIVARRHLGPGSRIERKVLEPR